MTELSANPAVTMELLLQVERIALQASAAIMQVYAGEVTVAHKADDSPLTQADRLAHQIIVEALHGLTPHIPVLSEESPAEQHLAATRQACPTLWLVDPLDGTREFINRNGEFTVNIALIQAGRAVLGVVTVPAQNLSYLGAHTGSTSLGAWRTDYRNATAQRVAIHTRQQPTTPVVVGSRSHRGDSLDALLAKLGDYELCAVGSALKFCRVAEGAADLYPRLGPTSEWDTAAGQAVLEAAGGAVFNVSGEPLRYNQRDTLLNPHFVALGDVTYRWQELL